MRSHLRSYTLGLTLALLSQTPVQAAPEQAPSPVAEAAAAPPPASIADLLLLLRTYVPDHERVRRITADMQKPVPPSSKPDTLALAWHLKAMAADSLQEMGTRGDYLAQALRYARQSGRRDSTELGSYLRIRNEYAGNLGATRGIAASQDEFLDLARELEQTPDNNLGIQISVYRHIADNYRQLGDLDNARRVLNKLDALYRTQAAKRGKSLQLPHWSAQIETARGRILQSAGRLQESERAFLAAQRQRQASLQNVAALEARGSYAQPEDRLLMQEDSAQTYLANNLIAQGRLDEAEVMLREVLKSSLVREGRNSRQVGRALTALSRLATERGHHAEANVLAEWSVRTLAEAGQARLSPSSIQASSRLASALVSVGRAKEAVVLIDSLRRDLADDTRLEEGFGQGSLLSVRAYILTNRINDALRDGDNLLRHTTRHFGAGHYNTAEARAYRAMALQRAGRVEEARKEFAAAIPVLTDPDKVVGKQNASIARTTRLRLILNEYLIVLVGNKGTPSPADIAEAFRIADVARWQSVQKALAGSALRAAAGSPELGARIKKVQDADDELQAVYKNLITQRSAPPEQQLPTVIKAMEQRITDLQKEQLRDLAEIRRQFPQYDELVNPRPANLATARRALKPKEALLSIYVTPGGSYVWATGPQGGLQFYFSPQKPDWVATQVKRLRDSVDLTTGISPDRLRFDLEAGAALYQELLAPVASAWAQADTLLVVANESLGQIPFSLLPTGATPSAQATPGLPLAQYRQVPWLARQVAVAYLPSVSALVTLRSLPASLGRRDPFVGFGDPDFGAQTEAGGTRGTRNLKIKRTAAWDESQTSADAPVAAPPAVPETPTLTALPDTREEITAIATAMAADLQRDAFFGAQANRQNVLASDLKQRRIVAFATHGLVAGDLPGLDQPALALSPAPGKTISEGLLKLEDILKLSLDADLVVLSACNTAAADGTGAEAVSGLGRGFFYAGARSVLATHWPVETVSARELVTHLFERYAKDPQLTRAQALRRAMLELIDTDVATDSRGQAVMAYAHPAFWAPYALYGDPGR